MNKIFWSIDIYCSRVLKFLFDDNDDENNHFYMTKFSGGKWGG